MRFPAIISYTSEDFGEGVAGCVDKVVEVVWSISQSSVLEVCVFYLLSELVS